MSLMTGFRSRANVVRALRTALLVGPILTVINQTPALLQAIRGNGIAPIGALRISLTFVVPFLVSLYSAAAAENRTGTVWSTESEGDPS